MSKCMDCISVPTNLYMTSQAPAYMIGEKAAILVVEDNKA